MPPEIEAVFASPAGALLIFCLRIVDVSCDTMRVLMAVRGKRFIAGVLGFFQALIWIFAVGTAIRYLDSWMHILGYAAGYAMGTFVGITIERLVAYYGRDLSGAHLPFNFQLVHTAWNAREIAALIGEYEAALPEGGWPNWVLGNHDKPRLATRVGRAQARVAAMLLLTLRGTPTLYYGDEIGMCDVPIAPDQVVDPRELNWPGIGLGRDPCRSPMQWDASTNGGFSTIADQPAIGPVRAWYWMVSMPVRAVVSVCSRIPPFRSRQSSSVSRDHSKLSGTGRSAWSTTAVSRPLRRVRSAAISVTSPRVALISTNWVSTSSSNGTCHAHPRWGSA